MTQSIRSTLWNGKLLLCVYKSPDFPLSPQKIMWFGHSFFLLALVFVNAITLSGSQSFSSRPLCRDHERSALLQFKGSFSIDCSVSVDPDVKVDSWIDGSNENCCSWDGVVCDMETGYVSEINLSGSCLSGHFPPNSSIFDLPHLKSLDLSYNGFNSSPIPSQLGRLGKLHFLDLYSSSFSGQVPAEMSQLSELLTLRLGDSSVRTNPSLYLQNPTLATLLRNLTHLQEIYFVNIYMSSPVPTVLLSLTSLNSVFIQYCYVYGELPSDLFRLPNLEVLNLNGNTDLEGSLPVFPEYSRLKHLSFFGTSVSGHLPPSIARLARLQVLELSSCHFSGSLPSFLGNLTTLTYLGLSGNDFEGVIKFSLRNLVNLESLYLSDLNVLPGQLVSQLAKLHKLKSLGLSGMDLGPEVPSSLANLTKLEYLDLGNTNLAGQIPLWFSNLTQLTTLYLMQNQLQGRIPSLFSQFINLQNLQLSYNLLVGDFGIFLNLTNLSVLDLSGVNLTFPPVTKTNSSVLQLQALVLGSCEFSEFPHFLQHQKDLSQLILSDNNINGNIPQWFMNKTAESLRVIDLSNNNLNGFEQPVVALPWSKLELLDFSNNKMQGQLPIPANSILFYDVSDNLLNGLIPEQFCSARFLVSFEISSNNISGKIPPCIGDQLSGSLELLNFRGNNLRGTIPPTFTSSCQLNMINLSENQLEGELPRSLTNCTILQVLDVGRNKITDTFPSWLGHLPRLQVLVLSHNSFHGKIVDRKTGTHFPHLRVIDLSHNLHTGDLPSSYIQSWPAMKVSNESQSQSSRIMFYFDFGVGIYQHYYEYSITITNKGTETLLPKILKVLRVIDFSCNNFTGKIPHVLGDLRGLQAVNLSNNNLEGNIPPSLSKIVDLESLDISANKLSGVIPLGMSKLTFLEIFNVSYNHLVGRIPQGTQFNTFDESSYAGNSGLCGSPLSNKCGYTRAPSSPQSPTLTTDESNQDSKLIEWIVRSLGCLSGFVVGFVAGKHFVTDRYHEWFTKVFGQRLSKRRARRSTRARG